MTKLQQLILQRQQLADAQKTAFAEFPDVATIPAEKLKEIETRNAEIKAADAEIERLTALEEMKSGAQSSFTHSGSAQPVIDKSGIDLAAKRGAELARVQTMPRVAPVKSFKGTDAELKAFQFGMWFLGGLVNSDRKYHSGFTEKCAQYCKDWGIETKAHSESVNTLGGYTVPHQFANDIIDLREEYGDLRKVIKVTPMASDTKSVMKRTSGLTVYYPTEGGAITASDKGWSQVNLQARKYAALSLYSSELNEDSVIDIGSDLAQEIAYAFALAEDTNGFNGDGTSTFCRTVGLRQRLLDVWTVSGGAGLIVGAGNAWSELLLTDFEKVLAALPKYARRGAQWICSSVFFHQVMHKLQLAAGGNTAMDIANGGTYRFLGLPVIESQVFPMTEANSQIPVVLGNYSLAGLLGDRRQMTIDFSDEFKWAEDQLAIKGTERVDINWHSVGDGTNAGPVVGLVTAAS